jgi:uncharacterized membrane protein
MRLHELHPALVHLPLALAPAAAVADAAAVRAGRSDAAGAWLLGASAAGAAAAALSGFVAQGGVRTPTAAHDALITHRTLNLIAAASLGAAALLRLRRRRPRMSDVLVETGASALMAYTGYLGGRMVYGHGVGVRPAGGVKDDRSPRLALRSVSETAGIAAANAKRASAHAGRHAQEGKLVPALRGSGPRHAEDGDG